jgi:epsilon-lactone hydrolase
LTWRLAKLCRVRVLCIDYRLAPEYPFPAALDDAVAAYRWLLAQGVNPYRIAVMGDSAGGGLAFATMLRLRDEGVELPAAAVVVSPWTDLALTGDSLRLNATIEPLIPVELAPRVVKLCLAGANPRNPYASPLYGDLIGLPPTLILVGGDDVLRDDAVRMPRRYAPPVVAWSSRCGPTCGMSGTCSHVSCRRQELRSRASHSSWKTSCDS